MRGLTGGIFGVPIGTDDEKEKERAWVTFIRSHNVVLFIKSD